MRIFPKAIKVQKWSDECNGICTGKIILYTSPITLFHELGHYYAMRLQVIFDTGPVYLFLDFLQDVWEFVNGVLRYSEWRKEVHCTFKHYVVIPWKDFIDFILARDVGV